MKAHICSSKKCNNDCGGTCAEHEDVNRKRPHYGQHEDQERITVSIKDLRAIFHGLEKRSGSGKRNT